MQQTKQQIVSKSELKGTKATLQTLKNIEQICCRICLEDMSPSETFAVCKCKGANSHVHEKCLLEWAKKTQKYRESFDIYYYNCQICKHKILLEVVTKLKCLKCRQISFCGQDFCCTFSSLTIMLMGLAMFIAGLYLKVTSQDSDIEYLFDLTLSLSVIIISFDLVLSILYFLLYNEVMVVGILLTEEQRKNVRMKEPKVMNSHQEPQQDSKKGKKKGNQNINQTQAFFMQDNNNQQVRQILDEARYQTLNRQQQFHPQPPRQIILFPENQNQSNILNEQGNNKSNILVAQAQNTQPNQRISLLKNQPFFENQSKIQNSAQSAQNQSLIRNELEKIHEQDFSTSTVKQFETRSILVRSISIKTRGDYKNNLTSYNSTPMNDESATFSNIQNDISHNQIPTPKSMMVKKPNPLTRFRKTLDESMVRSEIHLKEQKTKYLGQGDNDRVSQQGQEMENDVEILFVENSNKKLYPTGDNASSKKLLKRYNETELKAQKNSSPLNV